jgi:hypothetical protein
MRLTFDKFDARGFTYIPITDQDTGQEVGTISAGGVGFAGVGGISISLFGGKYQGYAKTYNECVGFVRGVQAALNYIGNHMTDTNPATPRAVRGSAA